MDNLHIPITGDNRGFINALNGAKEGVRNTARAERHEYRTDV